MAQWSRVLALQDEDPSLNPSTHVKAEHSCVCL